jgi:hypothetical protein
MGDWLGKEGGREGSKRVDFSCGKFRNLSDPNAQGCVLQAEFQTD